MLLAGCKSVTERSGASFGREEVFGYSVEGRPIRGTVLGSGADTILLIGVVHGDEALGQPLLERLVEHLEHSPRLVDGRTLIVIPVANPDGLERGSRSNTRGVDLNRNFPASDWRPGPRSGAFPGSEPEARTLVRLIRQHEPSRILAIHSPLRMVNYDGPGAGLARAMAEACGYPVTSSVGYPTPGSLGSYAAGVWETPTITLELGREVEAKDLWPRFRPALEVFIDGRQLAAETGR